MMRRLNNPGEIVRLVARIVTGQRRRPRVGHVDFGDLRRLQPISPNFGYSERGMGIARSYVDEYLRSCALHIKGSVLEVGDRQYTEELGVEVITSDVLNVTADDPSTTIVADLSKPNDIPDDYYDCVIITQTLNVIFDYMQVIQSLYRIVKPGGTVIATVTGISQISCFDYERWGDYWRFTDLSLRRAFEAYFEAEKIETKTYGNVLTATGILYGLKTKDFEPDEISYNDSTYQLIVCATATK